jgi:hypothetical protein
VWIAICDADEEAPTSRRMTSKPHQDWLQEQHGTSPPPCMHLTDTSGLESHSRSERMLLPPFCCLPGGDNELGQGEGSRVHPMECSSMECSPCTDGVFTLSDLNIHMESGGKITQVGTH